MGISQPLDNSPSSLPMGLQTGTRRLADQAVRAVETDTIVETTIDNPRVTVVDKEQGLPVSVPFSTSTVRENTINQVQQKQHDSEIVSRGDDPNPDLALPTIPLLPSTPEPMSGDLIVMFSTLDSSFNYRVDKDRCCRLSVKLSEVLEKASQAHSPSGDGVLQYLLVVDDSNANDPPQLVTHPLSAFAQIHQDQLAKSKSASLEALIKMEPDFKTSTTHRSDTEKRRLFAQAYRTMFIIMHGSWQDVDTCSSLQEIANEVEAIAQLATVYDVLPFARMYLRSLFNDHGDDVFPAIQNDPPRWLNLSIQLQEFWWFREAMIHIIGAFPSLPARWSDFNKYPVSTQIQATIEQKSRKLRTAIQNLIIDLSNNDMVNNDGQVLSFGERYEEWVAVHQWREWLSAELRNTRKLSGTTSHVVPDKIGPLIHRLRDGLSSCFQIEEKLKELPRDRNHHWAEYAAHMQRMADYAENAVKLSGLAKNKLKLKTKGKSQYLDYLTCMEVDKKDVPWKSR